MSEWRRPKGYANSTGVEVRARNDVVQVGGGVPVHEEDFGMHRHPEVCRGQAFTRAEFAAFVAAVKAGEYDDLTER